MENSKVRQKCGSETAAKSACLWARDTPSASLGGPGGGSGAVSLTPPPIGDMNHFSGIHAYIRRRFRELPCLFCGGAGTGASVEGGYFNKRALILGTDLISGMEMGAGTESAVNCQLSIVRVWQV